MVALAAEQDACDPTAGAVPHQRDPAVPAGGSQQRQRWARGGSTGLGGQRKSTQCRRRLYRVPLPVPRVQVGHERIEALKIPFEATAREDGQPVGQAHGHHLCKGVGWWGVGVGKLLARCRVTGVAAKAALPAWNPFLHSSSARGWYCREAERKPGSRTTPPPPLAAAAATDITATAPPPAAPPLLPARRELPRTFDGDCRSFRSRLDLLGVGAPQCVLLQYDGVGMCALCSEQHPELCSA